MRKHLSILSLLFILIITAGCQSEGRLKISSDKKGAEIFIDGVKKGIIGDGVTEITVAEGEHIVRVFKHTQEWNYEGEENTFVADKSSIDVYIKTSPSPTQKRIERLEQERIAKEKIEEEKRILEKKLQDEMKESLRIDKSLDRKRGTVSIDNLMWMRCSIGQVWTGEDCKGTAKTFAYYRDAESSISNTNIEKYAGFNNWRLPNAAANELKSLVYCSEGLNEYNSKCSKSSSKPTINISLFPNTPLGVFWSQSEGRFGTSVTFFNDGFTMRTNHPKNGKVRLVRSRN